MIHQGTKRLETERLILRRFIPEDAAPAFRNWVSDDDVTRFLTWPTHKDISVTERIIGMWIENYKDPAFYQWAIVPKDINEPIGTISVVDINASVESANIGYCIGKKWWHKGIVSEAFKEVIRFLFCEVELRKIEARHAPENPNSGGVMRKCGLTYEGTLRKAILCNAGITDLCMYSILREEYRASMLKGTVNTRDLGGYRTADGRETKYFRILRSSRPVDLPEEDLELMRSKGVTTILDLRDQADLDRADASFKGAPGFTYMNFKIEAASKLIDSMDELPYIYMDIVHSPVMKDIFEAIADAESGVMYNCFSGKDRTGVISALILLLCGVGMEDVADDYMVSDVNCEPVFRFLKKVFPDVDEENERPHRWQLEKFFELFFEEYGSLDGYFDKTGVTPKTREKIIHKLMD